MTQYHIQFLLIIQVAIACSKVAAETLQRKTMPKMGSFQKRLTANER